ncbi:peptide-N(4)-(N-acetyl-beta-glucosaminyl)asparagine amidase-like [Littorina saxatilis]|uniref:Peptide-N(4)-(N-acetyl-beta-glucosaminyl)asparagine amidase n=1 Tax=Littorina saxatilis TaxID=31220 RepID=A0AAN9GPM0_9CAEN
MASNESAPLLLFRENSKAEFLSACELLLRLADNVLENPDEHKYRRIRIANPLLESKLLPVIGGMECLFEMGFVEDGEYLTLPADSSLRVLRQVRNELSSLCKSAATAEENPPLQTSPGSSANSDFRQESTLATSSTRRCSSREETSAAARPEESSNLQNTGARPKTTPPVSGTLPARPEASGAAGNVGNVSARPQGAAAATLLNRPFVPTVQARPTQTIEDLRRREAEFARRLQSTMAHVLMYEDPTLQEKARSIIPVARLTEEAQARLDSPEEPFRRTRGSAPPDLNDCILLELLSWFKKSFFQWVDSPPCESCGGSTHHAGSTSPTEEEELWGGSRVENHKCDTCGGVTRFPRYNHPGKLLDTRKGRCGEWANCFTLCCRALGFDARYALDWTDHVWTEVYSNSQKRWLHCDPCENTCDKPLLYEQGWGKKLTYVIAFSKDEIQDVTWRYSTKHSEILARRKECREPWLVSFMHTVFTRKLQGMSEAKKQEMQQRLVVEMVEFISVKAQENESLPGRSTGSLAWRQARGETGQAAAPALTPTPAPALAPAPRQRREYIFRLLQEEKHSEVVHVKYSCAQDMYMRTSANDIRTSKWHSCSNSRNVFRKEESDWKMAYLARNEDAEIGEICWKFDLTGEDLRIDKLELKASSTVYETGVVDWKICCDHLCFPVAGSQLQDFKTFNLDGGQVLTITATLSGGRGNVAWQHAQLFRQHLDDSNYPFEIILHLG